MQDNRPPNLIPGTHLREKQHPALETRLAAVEDDLVRGGALEVYLDH